jgi:DHA1 family multidrug resistance protein-like MFS transporter
MEKAAAGFEPKQVSIILRSIMGHPKPQAASARHTLTLLGIGTAISLLGDATLYTVLPNAAIAAQVGVSLGMVGILLAANRAVRLVLNGIMGALYDRLPRRGLLVASLFIGTISNLLYALGTGFWPLLAGRVAWGLAWALLWIGGNAVVLDVSTEMDRGRNSGRYQLWFMFGVAFSSFAGGALTDLLGFRGAMWLTTGVIGAAALLWLIALPETRAKAEKKNPPEDQREAGTSSTPWKFALAAGLPVFVSRFVSWGVLAATMILWLEGFLQDGLQIGSLFLPLATLTGGLTAATMLVSMIGAPVAGRISDRLGRRWPVLAGSMFLGAAGLGLMGGGWFIPALLGVGLAQLSGSSVEALIPAITGDRVGKSAQGRTLGMIYTLGDLGSTLGPPAALGLLELGIFSLPQIYWLSAAALIAVAVFAWLQRDSG